MQNKTYKIQKYHIGLHHTIVKNSLLYEREIWRITEKYKRMIMELIDLKAMKLSSLTSSNSEKREEQRIVLNGNRMGAALWTMLKDNNHWYRHVQLMTVNQSHE